MKHLAIAAFVLGSLSVGCGGQERTNVRSPSAATGHRDTPEENALVMTAFAAYGCKDLSQLDPTSPIRIYSRCNGGSFVFHAQPDGTLSVECEGSADFAKTCAAKVAKLYELGQQCTDGTRHCNN